MSHQLEKEKWYRIRYRAPNQGYDRKAEMQYLGIETIAVNLVHLFNARPTAGTQTMPDSWIISVEEISEPNKPFVAARWRE